jgi:hypothetical membrane protein
MNYNYIGIGMFLCISILTAWAIHKKIKNYLLANVCSALISSVLFQLIGIIKYGYLDPFYELALFLTFIYSFIIAMVVGLIFSKIKRPLK